MSLRTRRHVDVPPGLRAAIERAKGELVDGGIVHVWGHPEARFPGERYCHEVHAGHNVVFHVRAVPMTNGGWACMGCGTVSEEEPDGTA